jgi:hypothetical protein
MNDVNGGQAPDLAGLARQINARERRSRKEQLEHVRRQGEDLLAAKKLCKHGEWMKWVRENLEIGQYQVNSYMRFKLGVTPNSTEEEQWRLWQEVQGNVREDADDDADAADAEPAGDEEEEEDAAGGDAAGGLFTRPMTLVSGLTGGADAGGHARPAAERVLRDAPPDDGSRRITIVMDEEAARMFDAVLEQWRRHRPGITDGQVFKIILMTYRDLCGGEGDDDDGESVPDTTPLGDDGRLDEDDAEDGIE